jgi:hypothetical protein
MRYDYQFYKPGSKNDVFATLSSEEPLSHIEVGHSMTIESQNYSTTPGHPVEIRGVEVHMGWNKFRLVVHVFLVERE